MLAGYTSSHREIRLSISVAKAKAEHQGADVVDKIVVANGAYFRK
jgi:hypothetical protein